ncbi:hypothetical protein SLEP1_g12179 [Rubroshorea leprosula]|uniref:Disease resistance N-terminal domain-containing protein n=1 Tax=Rubroshorea leprosula TaxID=152421 RepID=A0AAV5IBM7_9ROSI|nr:hypothetical protein SLEP1_g12179 [Rubroshorea leprosula]
MGDLVLGPIVDATISKVISAATEQINLAVSWKAQLRRLCNKLTMIRAVLQDADRRQVGDSAVKLWLENLRDVAREAEDVLDEVVYERLKQEVQIQKQMKKKVCLFFTFSNPFIFRLKMATKIKNLIASIVEINKEATQFGLQSRHATYEPRSNPQTAYSSPGYCPRVIGREGDVSKIVDLLIDTSNKEPLSVISVLQIRGCLELTSIGDGVFAFPKSLKGLHIRSCPRLETIGDGISTLTCLEELSLTECEILRLIPIMSGLSSLQYLQIRDCLELTRIGDGAFAFPASLRQLLIWSCPRLETIGEGISTLTCLEALNLSGFEDLWPISSVNGLSSLRELWIAQCSSVVSLPNGLSSCTALKTLWISNCHNLISISEDLKDLRSLVDLGIFRCENLRSIPEESFSCLVCLEKLVIGGFSKELEEFPYLNSIHHLHASLQKLCLIGWEKLTYLPPQIQHLTSLRKLNIDHFNQVEALPEWLGSLSFLQTLWIEDCANLKYLPSAQAMQGLSKLQNLRISECPELKGRCAKETGLEWFKISHIPNIEIDYVRIQ